MTSKSEETVVDHPAFPAPDIVACFSVYADEYRLLLRYNTDDEKVAILFFPGYNTFRFGAPNDEAIDGHPLYEKGLELYSAQKVLNSSWIDELERQNSVHDKHERGWFLDGLAHYIFTGQDSTFECVVREKREPTEIQRVSLERSHEVWQHFLSQMD
jgi:hypothetical protein